MKQRLVKWLITVVMLVLLLAGCSNPDVTNENAPTSNATQAPEVPEATNTPETTQAPKVTQSPEITQTPDQTTIPNHSDSAVTSDLQVHFIDVGQGDCILVTSEGQSMLIDAGNNKDGKAVVEYLKNAGIKTLDYIVGTHPDADHIGGLDVVINSLEVKKVWMPKKEHTTKTYEDVLLAVKNKGLKITAPTVGSEITLGSAKITVFGPDRVYEDNNNNSIVLKVEHGINSFLLTGDAELEAEMDELSSSLNLSATVLKVGHHGSHSSTSKSFLEAVQPKYAVISCGVNNTYGHPHVETMNYLKDANVEIYRTDLEQTIIMTSDGKTIAIKTNQPSAIGQESSSSSGSSNDSSNGSGNDTSNGSSNSSNNSSNNSSDSDSYIGNINSKKFHVPTCGSLPDEKNRIYFKTREEAVNNNYDPCGRCNP